MNEFIDMWLLLRASTNDNALSVLEYLNQHFSNIKGWLDMKGTRTCTACNIELNDCLCGTEHNKCNKHLDNNECVVNSEHYDVDEDSDMNMDLPPNIEMKNVENNEEVPHDKKEMDE